MLTVALIRSPYTFYIISGYYITCDNNFATEHGFEVKQWVRVSEYPNASCALYSCVPRNDDEEKEEEVMHITFIMIILIYKSINLCLVLKLTVCFFLYFQVSISLS